MELAREDGSRVEDEGCSHGEPPSRLDLGKGVDTMPGIWLMRLGDFINSVANFSITSNADPRYPTPSHNRRAVTETTPWLEKPRRVLCRATTTTPGLPTNILARAMMTATITTIMTSMTSTTTDDGPVP
jgi:hypothetical protein